MWWGSVTLRVNGKDVPRDVARVRSRITHDDVKSGVNLATHKKDDGFRDEEGTETDRLKRGTRNKYIILYWVIPHADIYIETLKKKKPDRVSLTRL